MKTKEMMSRCLENGVNLKRVQYATTNSRGMLASGHRWEVERLRDGATLARGASPAQAFRRWKEFEAQRTTETQRPAQLTNLL